MRRLNSGSKDIRSWSAMTVILLQPFIPTCCAQVEPCHGQWACRCLVACWVATMPQQAMLQRYLSIQSIQRIHSNACFSQDPTELDQITTLSNGVRVASEAVPGAFSGIGAYIDAGSRSPLLTEESKHPREEYVISRAQSSYSAKSSFHQQIMGELPISHGCSFTQTVFNGPLY